MHFVRRRLAGGKIELNGPSIDLRFSSGWTHYIPGESAAILPDLADAVLYANKRAGKEQIEAK